MMKSTLINPQVNPCSASRNGPSFLKAFKTLAIATLLAGATSLFAQDLPVEEAVLTTAPNVPPPITRDHAAKVIVNLETLEFSGRLSDGV